MAHDVGEIMPQRSLPEEGRNMTAHFTLPVLHHKCDPQILHSYKALNKLFLKDQKWIASLF